MVPVTPCARVVFPTLNEPDVVFTVPFSVTVEVAPDEEPIVIAVVPPVDEVPIPIVLLFVPAPAPILRINDEVVPNTYPCVAPEPKEIFPGVEKSEVVAWIVSKDPVPVTFPVIVNEPVKPKIAPVCPIFIFVDPVPVAIFNVPVVNPEPIEIVPVEFVDHKEFVAFVADADIESITGVVIVGDDEVIIVPEVGNVIVVFPVVVNTKELPVVDKGIMYLVVDGE